MPIVYKPSVMTGRFAQEMIDGQGIDFVAEKIAQVIADWDLMDNGKKVSVSAEAIANLPTAMVTKMFQKILEDSGLNTESEGKVTTMNRASRRGRQTSTVLNGS
jgi:hypothetical protein